MIPNKQQDYDRGIIQEVYSNMNSKEDPLQDKVYQKAISVILTSNNFDHEIKTFFKEIVKIKDDFIDEKSTDNLAEKKSRIISIFAKELAGKNKEKLINNKHVKKLMAHLDNGLLLEKDRLIIKQMRAKLEDKPFDEVFTTIEAIGKTAPNIIKEKLDLMPGDLVFMGYKPTPGMFASNPPKSSDEAVKSVGHSAMWVEGDKNLAHVCYAKGSFSTGGATLTGLLMTDTYAIFRCKRKELTEKVANLGLKLCSQKKMVSKKELTESYPDFLPVKIIKKKIEKIEKELKNYSKHNRESLEKTPLFDRIFGKTEAKEINNELCLPVWEGSSESWVSKQNSVKKRSDNQEDNLYEQRSTKYNHLNGMITKYIFIDENDLEVPDQFTAEEVRRALKFASRYDESSLSEKAGVRCSEFVIALFHSAAFEEESRSNSEKLQKNLESSDSTTLKEYLPTSLTLGSKLIRTNYLAQKVNNDDEFEYVGYFDVLENGVVIGYPSGDVEFIKNK